VASVASVASALAAGLADRLADGLGDVDEALGDMDEALGDAVALAETEAPAGAVFCSSDEAPSEEPQAERTMRALSAVAASNGRVAVWVPRGTGK